MDINQAFNIFSRAGDIRAARIITENTRKFSRFRVWKIARQLRRGVPVAKIIGKKWFYGLEFYTNRHTLDPRPDTETLVQVAISAAREMHAPRILDLGTGTGCVLVAILNNVPDATGVGIDISRGARRVAKKNIRDMGLARRATVRRASFARPHAVRKVFDIIVSNPPYIARGDKRVDAGAQHDPKIALYARDRGTAAYRAIAKNAHNWIRPGGILAVEIGAGMTRAVTRIFTDAGWRHTGAYRDMGGITRVLKFSPKN